MRDLVCPGAYVHGRAGHIPPAGRENSKNAFMGADAARAAQMSPMKLRWARHGRVLMESGSLNSGDINSRAARLFGWKWTWTVPR